MATRCRGPAFIEGVIPALDLETLRARIGSEAPAEHQKRLLRLTEPIPPEQLTTLQEMLPSIDPGFLEGAMNLGPINDVALAIAGHLKTLIRDGDTIQVGVGTPSTLMFNAGAFDDAHDLGLHTELGSPGLAKLWDRGVLTNAKKSIHRGAGVAVAWSGCDGEDIAIIRDNPAFELYDPNYLLHPTLMAQNNQMTSINSAVAVDLLGQIVSEDRYGGQMINGPGHQPDTHLGASLCRNGRAITIAAIDGPRWVDLEDACEARRGDPGHDSALPRGHRHHRIWHRAAARQEPPAAWRGADPHRPP